MGINFYAMIFFASYWVETALSTIPIAAIVTPGYLAIHGAIPNQMWLHWVFYEDIF